MFESAVEEREVCHESEQKNDREPSKS